MLLINEVTILGCGGNDIYQEQTEQIERRELKIAAYHTEKMFQGDFKTLIDSQLKHLNLKSNTHHLYQQKEERAFSIFLSLVISDFENDSSVFKDLADTIFKISKSNYISEQSFSRLWVVIFTLSDDDIIGWSSLIKDVDKRRTLTSDSTRKCFFSVLRERVNSKSSNYDEYEELLEAYNDILKNHCFFPLM